MNIIELRQMVKLSITYAAMHKFYACYFQAFLAEYTLSVYLVQQYYNNNNHILNFKQIFSLPRNLNYVYNYKLVRECSSITLLHQVNQPWVSLSLPLNTDLFLNLDVNQVVYSPVCQTPVYVLRLGVGFVLPFLVKIYEKLFSMRLKFGTKEIR